MPKMAESCECHGRRGGKSVRTPHGYQLPLRNTNFPSGVLIPPQEYPTPEKKIHVPTPENKNSPESEYNQERELDLLGRTV